ncbi:undecaprenyldiphospho-muramoylpentapeptide beta-N-acetylglucosaminyltransferase [Paenibacillus sp. PAMC21692]|uniref:undecaprenyldiphospho-muramoylpentapeptide beta-N-acetylglucosaminyltransferase n=1 Tax=Paenibacillus sp. PAMC21692 TaxID=2762320 RepID=UPI00164CF98D|nr:undecaprenyldiphospho-muramoylpentapeptide beta-N-acetylglucosaminyltransferase [Paenibacillus sp. PAMC21692]QNK59646.1 undecaprenyldiphospho-muramoylpentapeptide beta-N-acetylglucosaminyltransferase [Paenibacillus sp. PAMC21692]
MKKIMFTGGGSAGHVTANLALIPYFRQENWSIHYIGSVGGIERKLIEELPDVRYWPISTGKLRRYLDWNNVKDPFKVVGGLLQAYRIIRKEKPNVVFSKGGFVSVPVVIGAWLNRVPVLIHESDMTPGLANRIALPFASGICTTFPETTKSTSPGKSRYIGPVIRDELLQGKAERGRELCGFRRDKPVLLIMGGSLGARRINEAIRKQLSPLTSRFQIVHLCGKGGVDAKLESNNYRQFEYVNDELPHLLASADIVISRAGSNSIFEFLALRKPMLLIPLTKGQSRGDQILNAESFRKLGYAEVLPEEQLTPDSLLERTMDLYGNRERYKETMKAFDPGNGIKLIRDWITTIMK